MEDKVTFDEVLNATGKLVYKNVGVSMMPLIRENKDLMIIEKEPINHLKRLDAVLFKRPGVTGRGQYILHRILRVNDDGTYWIVGDNCFYGETVKKENIIGVLTGVIRDGKTVHVTDKKYMLYVHLWCDAYPLRFLILKLKHRAVKLKYKVKKSAHKAYLKYKKIGH